MLLATVGGDLPARATERQLSGLYAMQAERWDKGAAGGGGYQGHRLVAEAQAYHQSRTIPAPDNLPTPITWQS